MNAIVRLSGALALAAALMLGAAFVAAVEVLPPSHHVAAVVRHPGNASLAGILASQSATAPQGTVGP
jgi:hypothetical protein